MTAHRIDLTDYIDIPVWYGCNSDCILCMLTGLKSRLPAIGFDVFRKIVSNIVHEGRYHNLILSGAEVTTFVQLADFARFASSFQWFGKIQIQTNGRKLGDKQYLHHLVDAGVNEFFISVHGLEKVHDAITRIPGAYRETMQGIRHLEDLGMDIITNTVFTRMNCGEVKIVMEDLCGRGVKELQLWNYCPMEETDSRDLLVSMKDFSRFLPEILAVVLSSGKALVLKHFPQCLDMGPPGFFDSRVPRLLIHEIFWRKFAENRFGICPHADSCGATACSGLSMAHVRKYGDERDLLRPIAP